MELVKSITDIINCIGDDVSQNPLFLCISWIHLSYGICYASLLYIYI